MRHRWMTVAAVVSSCGFAHAEEVPLVPRDPSGQAPDSPTDSARRDEARRLFEEGLAAYKERRFTDALTALSHANQLMPHPAFAYNLGLVCEAMGRPAEALSWYRSYAREASEQEDLGPAREKIATLEAILQSQGVQQLTVMSRPNGAGLEIDGDFAGRTPLTVQIPPGPHRLRLTLGGHQPLERDIELPAHHAVDVTGELVVVPPVSASKQQPRRKAPVAPTSKLEIASAAPEPTRGEADAASPLRTVGWVGIVAGAASLAGAGLLEWQRRVAEDDASQASQRDYPARWDTMNGYQVAARVAAGAGLALGALGVGLVVGFSGDRDEPARAGVGLCAPFGMCAGGKVDF